MKRFTRCFSLFLAIMMLLVTPAFAVEPRASDYFSCTSTYLYRTSDTSFEAWFEVTGTGTMQQIGVSSVKIQRSSDNSNWTTMVTYSKDDYYSKMICENTTTHANYFSHTSTKGYYYRAYVTYYAKNSSGTGYLYQYTSSIKL